MSVTVANGKEPGIRVVTVEVSVEETETYLDRAATRLASKHQIAGFRPGKAPLSMIRAKFGEAAILEEALQEIVSASLFKALKEQKLITVGSPEIQIEKQAPGNPIVYSATVTLLPEVKAVGWREIAIEKKPIEVSDTDVDSLINELRDSQASEKLVLRPAKSGDKVEVNFTLTRDNVPMEGGSAAKYPIVLGKKGFIPGFEEHILGMSAGEKKNFPITFPKPYFKEEFAGVVAQVALEVVNVYERVLPEKNDAWAQSLMSVPYDELVKRVRENLKEEKEHKERSRLETELFDKLLEKTTITEVPESLLANEITTMIHELRHDIDRRGMKWADYLGSIKSTEENLKNEFRPGALKRIKSALLLRSLADELEIKMTSEEIEAELARQRVEFKDNPEALEQVSKPAYKDYISRALSNRKVVENLISLLVKS